MAIVGFFLIWWFCCILIFTWFFFFIFIFAGSKFDIKDFHSIILKDGALPLDILTKNVNQWIDETKRGSSVTAAPCISKASTNSRHLNLLMGAVMMCFLFKFRVFWLATIGCLKLLHVLLSTLHALRQFTFSMIK